MKAIDRLAEAGQVRAKSVDLSPHERMVAELASSGLTDTDIGLRLRINAATVKFYLFHAFVKLGITRRSQILSAMTSTIVTCFYCLLDTFNIAIVA